MKTVYHIALPVVAVLATGCGEKPAPVSVEEFMQDGRLLDSTMVICSENRSTLKYEPECVNAREAAMRLEARVERQRREALEQQSERKREALRRTRQANLAARQREIEEAERAADADYHRQFETPELLSGNDAGADAETEDTAADRAGAPDPEPPLPHHEVSDAAMDGTPLGSLDLGGVREELQRRFGGDAGDKTQQH